MDIVKILDRYSAGDEFQRPVESAIEEITTLRQRVAELEGELLSTAMESTITAQVQNLNAERDALKQQRDELAAALWIAEPVMEAHAGPSRLADFRAALASVKEKT